MGTPDFAVPALSSLVEAGYDVRAVVTQPDRPKGRGRRITPSPVKAYALEKGLTVLQPESVNKEEFLSAAREISPDLSIVVAFGQILGPKLLEIPRYGTLNIHASLLPKYRGAAPIQWSILNDEAVTGVTFMRMEEGLDSGPVLFQKTLKIGERETAGSLHDRLARLGGDWIGVVLDLMSRGELEEVPQDPGEATYASKITRETTRIDWSLPAREVAARIRAMDPHPGAVTTLDGVPLKVFSARVVDQEREGGEPGRVEVSQNELIVDTGRGRVGVDEVQAAGKKRMAVEAFIRGFSLGSGCILGH